MRILGEMIQGQDLLILPPSATVDAACRGMRDRRVGAVLVAEPKSRLVGIFTGRDAVCRVLAEGLDATTTPLVSVMTPAPTSAPPEASAIDALRLMRDCSFRHVPVSTDGTVIGIVSRGDFSGLEVDRLDEESRLWERI